MMNLAQKIFDHVHILKITFQDAEKYSCHLLKCRLEDGKLAVSETQTEITPEGLPKAQAKVPFIVVFCGYGIISKAKDSLPASLVGKLDSGKNEFISDEQDGIITLLRREQAENCIGELEKSPIACAALSVSASEKDEDVLCAARRQLEPVFKIKRMLTPDRTGAVLSGIFVSKIKLPFLALVLSVLVGNYFYGERKKAEAASLKVETAAYERAVGAAGEADRQKAELIRSYKKKIPHGFSWICDRIAIGLPKTLTLNSLKVQPLTKKIENGKPVLFEQGKVEVVGQASNSEDVTLFITALTRLNFARVVKMASLEQNRNSGELQFRLQLEL